MKSLASQPSDEPSIVQENGGTVFEVDYALEAAIGQPLHLGDEAFAGEGTPQRA